MREITRAILPKGVLFDDEPSRPEIISFSPTEICAGYWRPKKWRVYGNITIPDPYGETSFAWDIPFVACNLRSGKYDYRFDVDVPSESIPETEVDLTRTYGTKYDIQVSGTTVYSSTDPTTGVTTGGTITDEARATFELFTHISRKWNFDDWNKSEFFGEAYFTIHPFGISPDEVLIIIGAIDPGDAESIEVPWDCISWDRDKKLTAIAQKDSGTPAVRSLGIQGSCSVEVLEYWPYACEDGTRPKFDKETGEPIIESDV